MIIQDKIEKSSSFSSVNVKQRVENPYYSIVKHIIETGDWINLKRMH